MIGRDEIAAAARKSDGIAETQGGIPGWCKRYDIEPEGLLYVCEQRALRAVMLGIDKQNPTKLPRDRKTPVRLSPLAQAMLPVFQAQAIDGFAIGLTTRDDSEVARLRSAAARALERTQVDDSGEATMILEQVVNLDGSPVPPKEGQG